MAKVDKTLKKILATIDKDVSRIKRLGTTGQLAPADALTLSRYVSALSNVVEETQKVHDKEKQKLDKLPTDQLIEMYKKTKKGKKDEDA